MHAYTYNYTLYIHIHFPHAVFIFCIHCENDPIKKCIRNTKPEKQVNISLKYDAEQATTTLKIHI